MEVQVLRERAMHLDGVLGELARELDSARSADRQALRSLGISKDGATERAYSDRAFEIWQRKHNRDAADLETIHHLAIMHHARAIDLEQSGEANSSDADWEVSMKLWYELWLSEEFWDSIAGIVSKSSGAKPAERLREEFPISYLQLHYDIATDEDSPVSRRNYHVQMALESPFPDSVKSRVRLSCYEKYALKIPDTIWSTLTPDVAEAQKAGEIILEFLRVDPDCVPALGDALRIMVRFVRSRANDLTAVGDDQIQRQNILSDVRVVGERWRPYFERLLTKNDNPGEDMRADLCLWGRVMGDVMQALERNDDAIDYYRMGELAGTEDDTQRVMCRRNNVVLTTKIAYMKVQAGDEDARRASEALAHREDLIPEAFLNLGYAFYTLDDMESSLSICERGLKCEPESIDYDLMEEDDRQIELLEGLRDAILGQRAYQEAHEAFAADDFALALQLFDESVRLRPADSACLFFRSRTHVRLKNPDAAQADLDQYRSMSPDEAEGPSDHFKVVQDELETLRVDLARFGPKAMDLRDAALAALRNERYEEADEKISAAIDATTGEGGVVAMNRERSVVLAAWAVSEANQASESLEILQTARARMQLAVELDGENAHAVQNHAAIDNVIRNLTARTGYAEAIAAMGEEHFDVACEAFSKVIELAPEPAMFLMRAQCYIAMLDAKRAFKDLERVGELDASDDTERENAAKLIEQAKTLSGEIKRFGKEALRLFNQANRAYSRDDYSASARCFREAITKTKAGGESELRRNLSIVLVNWALNEYDQNTPLPSLVRCRIRMEEAIQVDPDNTNAVENLAGMFNSAAVDIANSSGFVGENLSLRIALKSDREEKLKQAVGLQREAVRLQPANSTYKSNLEQIKQLIDSRIF